MASNTEQVRLSNLVVRALIALLLFQSLTICFGATYLLYPFFITKTPQHVLTSRVKLGEPVGVEAEKCNLTLSDLTVGGVTFWVRETPSYIRLKAQEVQLPNGVSFKPGCIKRIYANEQPAGIMPGVWHLEGANSYYSPLGIVRTVGWHSESFEILPNDNNTISP